MDLISRERIIEDIVSTESEVAKKAPFDPEWFGRLAARQHEIIDIIMAAKVIKSTASADWVLHDNEQRYYKCSNCNYEFGRFGWRYCPICGRQMRGEEGVENNEEA